MKIVIGLGNPGPRYSGTRHNIGFEVITRLAERLSIRANQSRHNSVLGKGYLAGEPIFLQQPLTYMNRSGMAVKALIQELQTNVSDIIVVVDDLDLPLGKIRIKGSGGSGGHNGMKSIISELGSRDFARLRIGIGRPEYVEADVSDYVLEKWSQAEKRELGGILDTATDALLCFLSEGVVEAANRFNASVADEQ